MKNTWLRKEGVDQLGGPRHSRSVPLAAPPERTPPEVLDVMAKRPQRPEVCGHPVVGVQTRGNLSQPLPLLGDRLVHPASQLLLDLAEFGLHTVAPGLPALVWVTFDHFLID